jgi:hypothetical protein
MISISAAWLSPPPPGNVNALTGVAMPAAAATVAAMTSFRIALSVIYKPLPSIERATLRNVSGMAQALEAYAVTLDGLDSYAESTRKGAENKPIGQKDQSDDIPVFDRGDALPSV